MSKRIEELSKDLAGGMSRRRAFWRFFAGTGAALFVTTKPASAGIENIISCVEFCLYQRLEGKEFDDCVIKSALCPRGECAVMSNGGHFICVPVG
jgi:hypothetical protein